jgi:hypothetical protein
MKIWKEKPGVISKGPCWCCLYSFYLHTSNSLLGLVVDVVTHWKSDKRLAM